MMPHHTSLHNCAGYAESPAAALAGKGAAVQALVVRRRSARAAAVSPPAGGSDLTARPLPNPERLVPRALPDSSG